MALGEFEGWNLIYRKDDDNQVGENGEAGGRVPDIANLDTVTGKVGVVGLLDGGALDDGGDDDGETEEDDDGQSRP